MNPALNINRVRCVYVGLIHLIKTLLCNSVGGKVVLLQTQITRRHLDAFMVHIMAAEIGLRSESGPPESQLFFGL